MRSLSQRSFLSTACITIGVLALLGGCTPPPPPVPSDGTITVRLTGASAYDGKEFLSAVANKGGLGNPAQTLGTGAGTGYQTIVAGTIDEVMSDTSVYPSSAVIFRGGNSYDAGGLIDVDGDKAVTSGVDYIMKQARNVTVNGNTLVVFSYPADFMLAP
jgi:hypothetical protein